MVLRLAIASRMYSSEYKLQFAHAALRWCERILTMNSRKIALIVASGLFVLTILRRGTFMLNSDLPDASKEKESYSSRKKLELKETMLIKRNCR